MFRIGCDPEIFLKDKKTGKYISGHDLCPGTKQHPFEVSKGAVQVDGLALEVNITPAESREDFISNVQTVLAELRKIIPRELEFSFEPAVEFEDSYMKTLPDYAKELGCNPDWNAYLKMLNPPPDGSSTNLRTGAGHIHVGWQDPKGNEALTPDHIDTCSNIVRYLDKYVAFRALGKNGGWDFDEKRRSLYGKAGAFRPKAYGVEFRTPSNAWLRSPKYMGLIYDWTLEGLEAFMKRVEIPQEESDYIQKALSA